MKCLDLGIVLIQSLITVWKAVRVQPMTRCRGSHSTVGWLMGGKHRMSVGVCPSLSGAGGACSVVLW